MSGPLAGMHSWEYFGWNHILLFQVVGPVTLIHDCDLVISHVMNLSSLDQECMLVHAASGDQESLIT